jgi:hypothetical protein
MGWGAGADDRSCWPVGDSGSVGGDKKEAKDGHYNGNSNGNDNDSVQVQDIFHWRNVCTAVEQHRSLVIISSLVIIITLPFKITAHCSPATARSPDHPPIRRWPTTRGPRIVPVIPARAAFKERLDLFHPHSYRHCRRCLPGRTYCSIGKVSPA